MSAWAVPGYTEERELGRGASGRVVAATSSLNGQRVAIKYLGAGLLSDPAYMVRFRMEARLLTQLDVPEIVRLFAYREEPGAGAAIVMELVDGVSLHELISRQGPTSPESALVVLKGSLLGLAAAHSVGVVHRDYKPENVLVDATGQSKLADFGVAVKAGDRVPVAGTPLYMAPEQWAGAPATPATDIYAATAVFYECLTGRTPFSGRLRQLRQQHEYAPVPSNDVDEPLRPLIERGLAKNPAARAADAAVFVAELEATAAAAYGPDWERRGRAQLAARASALLLLLLRRTGGGPAASTDAVTWFLTTLRRRKKTAIAAAAVITAAVVAIAGTAIATTGQHHPTGGGGGASNGTVVSLPRDKQSVLAAATTTPPAAAGSCKGPTAFKYAATLTASQRGPVTYRWVYSPAKPSAKTAKKIAPPRLGPVHTVQFAAAGARLVSGGEVRQTAAGTGWAEIEVISPVEETSNKAGYRLLCQASKPGHATVKATATVVPKASGVTCGSAPPSFTFAGSVTSSKGGPVTYYWALGDGATTTPATLHFAAAGTMSVQPLAFTPQTDSATGNAVLVVTSPDAAVSNTATFTLSCHGHGGGTGGGGSGGGAGSGAHLAVSAAAKVSPASSTVGCTFGPSTFTFTGTIIANQATTVTYYWALSSGAGQLQTLTFAEAGTQPVAPATFTPPTDSYSGAGEIIITSPVTSPATPPSNKETFTQSCTSASLHVTSNTLPPAIQHATYSATLSAAGGKAPYTWKATNLPAGLTISPSGVIGGSTDAAPGNYTVTVTVADSEAGTARTQEASASARAAKTASASLSLTVKAPAFPALQVTTATLPAGIQGAVYGPPGGVTAAATGGNGHYAWSATGLPDGLTMSASGVISGTPAEAGTYSVVLTVADGGANPPASGPALTLTVAFPALRVTTATLPAGTAGAAYDFTAAATGGSGDYAWSATGLPAGLTISAAGVISGSPDKAGTYSVVLTVADGGANPPASGPALTLTVGYPALQVTTATLPAGTQGTAYDFTAAATGGNGEDAWSATGLPDGLTISASGVISGSPDKAGTYSVVLTVADGGANPPASGPALTLTVGFPALQITATALPAAYEGAKYSATVTATGGDGNYTWSATGLPAGLSIDSSTGVISGVIDAQAQTFAVTVTVSDGESAPQTQSAALDLEIYPELTLTTATLAEGTVDEPYDFTVKATGGDGNYAWSATGLPDGLTMSSSGEISGTPTNTGIYSVTIDVTDESLATTASTTLNLTVGLPKSPIH